MNGIILLVVGLAASGLAASGFAANDLAAASAALTREELESLPIEQYTAIALAELKAMNRSRFLTEVQAPKCKIYREERAIECYLKFKWMKVQRRVSVEINFELQRLQLSFALLFDHEPLFEHKIDLSQICTPLPGLLKMIKICLHTYYLDVDIKQALSFDACFLIKISDFFHLRLNCVRLDKNGRFSHHHEHAPESEGIITISIEDGNLKFKFNNPIPKEIIEKIENGWKQFEKDTKTAFHKAGKDLYKFGKDIEKGWNKAGIEIQKFGKEIEKGFEDVGSELEKYGKEVERGFKDVGEELEKVGKKIEEGFRDFGQKLKDFFG